MTTIPTLHPIWEFSAAIFPTATTSGWSNLFHATIGNNHGRNGDRTPGIWFHSATTKLHICSAITRNNNYCFNSEPLPMNEWSTLEISQSLQSNGFQYKIQIDGSEVHAVINYLPQEFNDVKFYASDPWSPASAAKVANVAFNSYPVEDTSRVLTNQALVANTVDQTIPVLYREWTLSFDITPIVAVSGWSNILHVTIGNNHGRYGDRTPGIWFISGTTKLHICAAVNGNSNYCFNSEPLTIGQSTPIEIKQSPSIGGYTYSIHINNEKVHEVQNNQVEEFADVLLYRSDPWSPAALAIVKNIIMETSPSHTIAQNTLDRTILFLHYVWELSVEIYPIASVTGWSNILHATIGNNYGRYGDRTPAVWFRSGTTKLHICAPINGNPNYCFDSESLDLGRVRTIYNF